MPTSQLRSVLFAALLCGAILAASGVAEGRFIPGLNRVTHDKGEVFRQGCLVGHDRVRSGACRFGDTRSRKKVVLFGDSHAMQWGPGLIRLAKQKGWQVIALTRASCPAAMVRISYHCDQWRSNSLKRIRRMRPGMVLVGTQANRQGYRVTVEGSELSRDESEPYLVNGMIQTLRRLTRWSYWTIVMRDQALTPFSVTRCLHYRPPGKCRFRPDRPRSYSYDFKGTRRVKGARLIDPQPLLCPRGWCRAVDHDHLIYRNHGHLSASFARLRYRWLGRQLGDPWRRRG